MIFCNKKKDFRVNDNKNCYYYIHVKLHLHKCYFFVYRQTKEVSEPGHIDFIGTLGDRIQVFVDRNSKFTEDRIIIGKTTKDRESGVYFIQGDKSTEEFIDASGDKKITITYRQCIISTEGAENSFDVIRVSDFKRPFWKKLLFIK